MDIKIVWHKIAEGITAFVFFTLLFFYKMEYHLLAQKVVIEIKC